MWLTFDSFALNSIMPIRVINTRYQLKGLFILLNYTKVLCGRHTPTCELQVQAKETTLINTPNKTGKTHGDSVDFGDIADSLVDSSSHRSVSTMTALLLSTMKASTSNIDDYTRTGMELHYTERKEYALCVLCCWVGERFQSGFLSFSADWL